MMLITFANTKAEAQGDRPGVLGCKLCCIERLKSIKHLQMHTEGKTLTEDAELVLKLRVLADIAED